MGLAELIWNNGNVLYLTIFSVFSYAFLYSVLFKASDKTVGALIIFSLSFFTIFYFLRIKFIFITLAYVNIFIFAAVVLTFWNPKIKEDKKARGMVSALVFGVGVVLYIYA